MPSTPEEAKARLERAFRVKFEREPVRAQEQASILIATPIVAEGKHFRWEGSENDPQLRFGLSEEDEENAFLSDSSAIDAEDITQAEQILSENDKQVSTLGKDAKEDWLPKLTPKELAFCRFRASGLTQINSYYKAGYRASTRSSADTCASIIAKKPHVQAYLRKLRESTFLVDVLTLAEKRAGLAEVWRTPVGELNENHPLAQEVTRKVFTDKDGNQTGEEIKVKMPDKLRALELDAKLAGELKESSGQGNSLTLNLIQQRMDIPSAVSGEYIQADAREILQQDGLPE